MPVTVAQLAELIHAELEGDGNRVITGANSLEDATAGDLSFVSSPKGIENARSSRASCLVAFPDFDTQGPWSVLRVSDPRAAFAQALNAVYPPKRIQPFVHPTAIVAPSASVHATCFIGAYVTIGENTKIGAGSCVGNGSRLGDNVNIGENTTLHPNVTIYDNVSIGARVIIHSGVILGADGFGFTLVGDRYQKFPQVGTIRIEDDVEIGANCCVDRAALGVTRIGEGTKLDNLVHVAHNCNIGKHVVIAAQTGFSGSVTVGDYAMIGGQTGIGEKAKIQSKAVIGGKAGVLTGQIVTSGEPVWGIPARPLRQHLKSLAHVARLEKYKREIEELKAKVSALELLVQESNE